VDLTNNIRNHFERNRLTIGNVSRPGPQVTPPSFEEFCAAINRSCRSNAMAMVSPYHSSFSSAAAAPPSRAPQATPTNRQSPVEIGSYLEEGEESVSTHTSHTPPAPAAAASTTADATPREGPSTPRSLHDFSYGAFREYISPSSSEDLSSCSSADPGEHLSYSSDPSLPLSGIDEFEFSEEQQLMFISSKPSSPLPPSLTLRSDERGRPH
jgi:hypothetical protein